MGLSDSHIWIISSCTAQNNALGHIIKERINSTCYTLESSYPNISGNGQSGSGLKLLLFDCIGKGQEELFDFLQLSLETEGSHRLLIMFNLQPDFGHEKEALEYGVNGFLYTHDCLDTFIKAIETVLSGEVWISRQKIAECLYSKNSPDKRLPDLTSRELEILKILAKGYSNEMIAEELCISSHTVKTHLSNIFKKINVHRRRHAVQWVETHF